MLWNANALFYIGLFRRNSNDDLFLQHSINARKIIETDKNWEKESSKLIALIESLKNFK